MSVVDLLQTQSWEQYGCKLVWFAVRRLWCRHFNNTWCNCRRCSNPPDEYKCCRYDCSSCTTGQLKRQLRNKNVAACHTCRLQFQATCRSLNDNYSRVLYAVQTIQEVTDCDNNNRCKPRLVVLRISKRGKSKLRPYDSELWVHMVV